MTNDLDALLKPYQHFGVHLGLERIQRLLSALGNPHHRVKIVHVAGTNGKGSVCAYLSSVLTQAGYTVGRYTSPHLVHWNERICLNEQPIPTTVLAEILQQIQAAIPSAERVPHPTEFESPTQFEVITAAAWLYFAQKRVDIAIMEVGLGGRLDATNVCDHPLVSVITSISREHWQVLGPTVAHIAGEKAGILKPGCATVIGNLPPDAKAVVASRLQLLNCPAVWVSPSSPMKQGWAKYTGNRTIEYPLALLGDIQLMNSAIAIAVLERLQEQGFEISDAAIVSGMAKTRWSGRIQWIEWLNRSILIDGAHNPAAALSLRQYVDSLNQPVSWVMGILSTKDHQDIFEALLRPGDRLYLVPVPEQATADPAVLAALAKEVCPHLDLVKPMSDLFSCLEVAINEDPALEDLNKSSERVIVLCGSLYLLGYFFSSYNQKLSNI
ncbi:bifunctional folylpolyglutamate synthase/dihydrofolate synthase [Gloeothece verrucosa]|uniref:tetrahydrofolate synthase n=1 Tax=Gloeothece verrucosa (strain PCC 7822) TaxID=497965 RepID=E0UF60_GLOV7|nr:folylpolyglutamate synthase/dihydrofolate synthase family protein [Gloeothece verrucosa]ADN14312.1 FolC bifunctional protein [Gloeothece verrucosa PCC 7822]